MKIKLHTVMAGPAGVHQAGAELNVSLEEARRLVTGGFASWIDKPPQDTTVVQPQQHAQHHGPRKRT